jgi:IstB-like ATP binding protein
MLRNDLVVIDDLGFTTMDRVAAEHLFRFVNRRYEKRSLIVATNVEFERWRRFLPDETGAAAILDRLLDHCHVVRLPGESFRLREARKLVTPAGASPNPGDRYVAAPPRSALDRITAARSQRAPRRRPSTTPTPSIAPQAAELRGPTGRSMRPLPLPRSLLQRWGIIWPPAGILVAP